MHFNCRNLNGTVYLQSLTTSCWLHTWEQTNSSNKFAANLNIKDMSFFYSPCILDLQPISQESPDNGARPLRLVPTIQGV